MAQLGLFCKEDKLTAFVSYECGLSSCIFWVNQAVYARIESFPISWETRRYQIAFEMNDRPGKPEPRIFNKRIDAHNAIVASLVSKGFKVRIRRTTDNSFCPLDSLCSELYSKGLIK